MDPRIGELSDTKLAASCLVLCKRAERLKLQLTKWEASAIPEIAEVQRLAGSLSWKQRRALRLFLERITQILTQRAWFAELERTFEDAASDD